MALSLTLLQHMLCLLPILITDWTDHGNLGHWAALQDGARSHGYDVYKAGNGEQQVIIMC
jgi:hypothetical protein